MEAAVGGEEVEEVEGAEAEVEAGGGAEVEEVEGVEVEGCGGGGGVQ